MKCLVTSWHLLSCFFFNRSYPIVISANPVCGCIIIQLFDLSVTTSSFNWFWLFSWASWNASLIYDFHITVGCQLCVAWPLNCWAWASSSRPGFNWIGSSMSWNNDLLLRANFLMLLHGLVTTSGLNSRSNHLYATYSCLSPNAMLLSSKLQKQSTSSNSTSLRNLHQLHLEMNGVASLVIKYHNISSLGRTFSLLQHFASRHHSIPSPPR